MDKALARLGTALDQLDAAVARQSAVLRGASALSESIAAMRDDRVRLAGELDRSLARTQDLESMSADVSARLDRAIASVREALEAAESTGNRPDPMAQV